MLMCVFKVYYYSTYTIVLRGVTKVYRYVLLFELISKKEAWL